MYYRAIRLSNRLIVYYDLGQGYIHTFLNGIKLYCFDGQKAHLIAQKYWGGCNYRIFDEQSAMEESVSDQIVILEDKLILLMTAVSISPFLGLFGTVWGIMLAFTEMAIQGKPDVATLAPGISGALLTTVLGLVVAIPSLVGYNYITFYIKQITVFMDNFVEETLAKFEMERVIQEKRSGDSAPANAPVQEQKSEQFF